MAYWQADLIVEGALQEDPIFYAQNDIDEYIEKVKAEYGSDEIAVGAELFVVFHDHSEEVDECACVQYLNDHHAEWTNER